MTAPVQVGLSQTSGGPTPAAPRRKSQTVLIMTPRRIEILVLAANGNTNADIARKLWLSEETIKTHMRKIHEVLGARDRSNAVALGIIRGFVRPDQIDVRPAKRHAA